MSNKHIADLLDDGVFHIDAQGVAHQLQGSGSMFTTAARVIRESEHCINEQGKRIEKLEKELDAIMKADISTIRAETIKSCANKVEAFEMNVPPTFKKKEARGFMLGRDSAKRLIACQLRMDAAMELYSQIGGDK